MKLFIKSTLTIGAICVVVCFVSCNQENTPTVGINTSSNTTQPPISSQYNVTKLINVDLKSTTPIYNQAAYVTTQCYTKTEGTNGKAHNPCFSCHINNEEPNYTASDDYRLQASYEMSEYTSTNHFTNLFKDRTEQVAALDDATILAYVRQNNYISNNTITLADKLATPPQEWDVDGDGAWGGYTPDCYFNFDADGLDTAPNGDTTWWRAFAYYPFLGTFWPTNGSMDDVIIRLSEKYRKDSSGAVSKEIYKINLAIVEAMIKRKDITIDSIDENSINYDLDKNGTLNTTTTIKYQWDLKNNKRMDYVGLANEENIAPGLYPVGTEFLHSVRYIDVKSDNTLTMAPRMKELRYSKKWSWNTYSQLSSAAHAERKEREDFPERLRTFKGNSEFGLTNGLGWLYQGFIEDEDGALRPQNYEETTYCMGCHSGIGATTDSSFVFPRKFDSTAYQQGWYHWSNVENPLQNLREPLTKDGRYEYSLYLEANGAGDEFRSNDEVMKKFYYDNGTLKSEEITKLHEDISHLLIPTPQRALKLNKGYKVIVDEQSFVLGRDAHITPTLNVHENIKSNTPTGNNVIRY